MAFVFDKTSSQAPYIETIWHTRSEQAGTFLSEASSHWELVFTTREGKTTVSARGPETRASEADFLGDAEYLGITFRLGTFMPHLPLKTLMNRQDPTLPAASSTAFWLHGSAWELPTQETADVFAERLIRQGILVRDPLVEAALQGKTPDISLRALQGRFVQATGIPHKTITQIIRVRRAVSLLESGTPALDTALRLGYFDQAHLTNALRRFVGRTPAQIAGKRL